MVKKKPSLRQVVNRIKRHDAGTLQDVLRVADVSATFVGDGCFRDVYKVREHPLVVKVPHRREMPMEKSVEHSRAEVRAIKESSSSIRRYVPKIYYFNDETGLVVMQFYKCVWDLTWPLSSRMVKRIEEMEAEIESHYDLTSDDWDSHEGNIGVGPNGHPVLIDFGYVENGWPG